MSTNNPHENSNNENNGEDERRAARLTAHALGQIDPAERAEIEAELAADPNSMKTVRESASLRPIFAAGRACADAGAIARVARGGRAPLEGVGRRRGRRPAGIPARKPQRSRRLWSILAVAVTLLVAVPTLLVVLTQNARRNSAVAMRSPSSRIRLRWERRSNRAAFAGAKRQGGGRPSHEGFGGGAAPRKFRRGRGAEGTRTGDRR